LPNHSNTHLKQDHNPIHNVAHYLKNSVTLESKEDEERREDAISDHAREEHGVKPKKEQFWEEHGKRPAVEGGVGFEGASGKETTNERVG
jgi:hypothetical protein